MNARRPIPTQTRGMNTAKDIQLEALADAIKLTPEKLQNRSQKAYYVNMAAFRLRELELAAPDAKDARAARRLTTALFASVPPLLEELYRIERDERYTAEHIVQLMGQRLDAWEATARGTRNELAGRGEAAQRRVDAATIEPPTTDAGVLEAMLGNARGDARMYLDATATHRVPHRMRELVEHETDPVITYLLVATRWGDHYIRSRAVARANDGNAEQVQSVDGLIEWAEYRKGLLAKLMPEAAAAAYQRDTALAKYIPQLVAVMDLEINHTLGLRGSYNYTPL